jgi:hypothetical protein
MEIGECSSFFKGGFGPSELRARCYLLVQLPKFCLARSSAPAVLPEPMARVVERGGGSDALALTLQAR